MTKYAILSHQHAHHYLSLLLALLLVMSFSGCAEKPIRVVSIPSPAESTKLRVYVEPFTHTDVRKNKSFPGGWDTSHDEFGESQVRFVEKQLEQTGIYEIVSKEDVFKAIGDQKISYDQMEGNDWMMAKKIGKALHADYVIIMARGEDSLMAEKYYFIALVNVETGQKFGVRYRFQRERLDRAQRKELATASYRDIFNSAKDDLFATAIKKGQRISSHREKNIFPETKEAAVLQQGQKPRAKTTTSVQPEAGIGVVPPSGVTTTSERVVLPTTVKDQDKQRVEYQTQTIKENQRDRLEQATRSLPNRVKLLPSEQSWLKEQNIDQDVLTQDTGITNGKKLAVYDLDASEQYKTAALIFSEALREEIFKLKKFTLVNRENIDKVLKEMALQQTGLLDDKDAVKTGKAFAAEQVITGRMGLLGKTFILQAKRIDVETFSALGLASAKFNQGQEEDALDKMQEFAINLIGQ